jgi:hypothetical protein
MKRLILLFLFTLIGKSLFSQFNRPSFYEVVEQFYSLYQVPENFYPRVNFEKRHGNWYIVTQQLENNRLFPVKTYKFYDKYEQQYLPLSLPKNNTSSIVNSGLMNWEVRMVVSDVLPSFGYTGWYLDVIKELEPITNPSDDELYALGRAYGSWTQSLLPYTIEGLDTYKTWPCSPSLDCLSRDRIDSFRLLNFKGIEYFRRLAMHNPSFVAPHFFAPHLESTIHTAYANEYIREYYQLLPYARQYALSLSFPDSLYTEAELAKPRTWLSECPRGAVFITFGDNEFYPMHYLQKKKGFRTDVLVLNFSLLMSDRFIWLATMPIYNAQPIKLSLPPKFYEADSNYCILRINNSTQNFDASQLSDFLRSNKSSRWTNSLDAGSISLKSVTGRTHKIILSPLSILCRNEWVIIDILNNLGSRQLCTVYPFFEALTGLNSFLKKRGSLWVYNP